MKVQRSNIRRTGLDCVWPQISARICLALRGFVKTGGVTMRVAITGAATGIGAEVVKLLKGDDHEVIAFDILQPENEDR